MSDPRTKLVGAGYDAMADVWEEWSTRVADDPRGEWLAKLVALVPAGGLVVELGCGNGRAETLESFELAEDEVVTISEPEGRVSFHWVLARR